MSQFVALLVFIIGVVPICLNTTPITGTPNSLRFSIGIAVSYFLALICRFLLDKIVAVVDRMFNDPMTLVTRLDSSDAYDLCFKSLRDYFYVRNLSLSCVPSEKRIEATWRVYHDRLCWLMFLTPWSVPSIMDGFGQSVEELHCDLKFVDAVGGGTVVTANFASIYNPASLYLRIPFARNGIKSLLRRKLGAIA